MSQSYINVIGAGLAGSEAAYQIAQQGIPVKLYEMRGVKSTPQHKTDNFAELVCSNSLRGDSLTNAVGLLKEEMRRLGSVTLEAAEATRVPAGGALAVDREGFANRVTEKVSQHPLIEVIRDEITELPTDAITVVATGPLTSDASMVGMASISTMQQLRSLMSILSTWTRFISNHVMTREKQLISTAQ